MHVRSLRFADLDAALALTQAEGWSHRREDWHLHLQLGKGWAVCTDDGMLAGVTLQWDYGNQCSTVGLVVVDKNQRGRGVGRLLMNLIIEHAGERQLRLVATSAAIHLYRQCGFIECGGVEQLQGILQAPPSAEAPAGLTLSPVTAGDRQRLSQLDAAAFGAPRHELISALLSRSKGFLAEKDGQLAGFALQREAGLGTLIGPVIARNQSIAQVLIARTLEYHQGFVRADVTSHAQDLMNWLKGAGLRTVGQYAAMVRGTLPDKENDSARVIGLASQAFG